MAGGATPTGGATGGGSMPGDDIDAALGVVADALPDLPHLPELPARGAGSDMIGRTAGQLVDLHIDLQPAGWRLVPRPGLDETRARDRLDRDLDALVPALPGYDGDVKIQLAGPWTLAATLELTRGGKAVGDRGAGRGRWPPTLGRPGGGKAVGDRGGSRDLAASLAEAARNHLADVARRLPAARLVLQLDEPALPAVLAGSVPTESGFGRVAAADPQAVRDALAAVVGAVDVPVVVHCCAAAAPVRLMADSGAAAVSVDVAQGVDLDEIGALIERDI